MDSIKTLKDILSKIDKKLDSYDQGALEPDEMVQKVFEHRAQQSPVLYSAIADCNTALEKYLFNSELLRRRAFLRTLIVTPDGEYPELEQAKEDLDLLIDLDPNNLYAFLDLLEAMFTFSGIEDSDVANMAEELAESSKNLMLHFKALQIKALAYADRNSESDSVFNDIIRLYPDCTSLINAKADADSLI